MGKVLSVATRPFRNFNIENRAHKVISKDKPSAAPLHQANLQEAERLLKENPESLTELMKKDTMLDQYLKDVYVKSYDPENVNIDMKPRNNPERPLPLNRRIIEDQEFGYAEPKIIPPGKVTLRQVMMILSNYQANPKEWDTKKELLKYNISEENLNNILHYFRIYHVHVPDKKSGFVYGAPMEPQQRLEGKN